MYVVTNWLIFKDLINVARVIRLLIIINICISLSSVKEAFYCFPGFPGYLTVMYSIYHNSHQLSTTLTPSSPRRLITRPSFRMLNEILRSLNTEKCVGWFPMSACVIVWIVTAYKPIWTYISTQRDCAGRRDVKWRWLLSMNARRWHTLSWYIIHHFHLRIQYLRVAREKCIQMHFNDAISREIKRS